jgi:hypothetical protein
MSVLLEVLSVAIIVQYWLRLVRDILHYPHDGNRSDEELTSRCHIATSLGEVKLLSLVQLVSRTGSNSLRMRPFCPIMNCEDCCSLSANLSLLVVSCRR